MLTKRVLVVDDDRDTRELLVQVLEGDGYRASAAENGEQALLEAKGERPDVILLDLMMPGMTGLEFREHQMREPSISEVPVIVLSSYADIAADVADLHAAAYLRKPLQIEQILSAVHQHAHR